MADATLSAAPPRQPSDDSWELDVAEVLTREDVLAATDEEDEQGQLTTDADRTVGEALMLGTVRVEAQQPPGGFRRSERTPPTAHDPLKIVVEPNFQAVEGVLLRQPPAGWLLGKCLGVGMQGCVFLLVDVSSGDDLGRVLKVTACGDAASVGGAVAEAVVGGGASLGLEREWVLGRELNTLADDDGYLPGFMQTGSAVISSRGEFLGLVLEKLNGMEVADRLSDPRFVDVRYVAEALRQCFCALDRAEAALGFRHRDARVENLMEHRLPAPPTKATSSSFSSYAPVITEQGEEEVEEEERGQRLPVEDEEEQQGGQGQHMELATPSSSGGFGSSSGDGEDKLPPGFGPRVPLEGLHFKIIDYGHAVVRRSDAKDERHRRRTRNWHRLLPHVPFWSWTENLYRWIFRDKGDVWRLSRSVLASLDGRVWPEADRREALALAAFLRKVTGVKMRIDFAERLEDAPGEQGQAVVPPDEEQRGEKKKARGPISRLLGAGGNLFFVRWARNMVQAYVFPGKPTMRPGEAMRLLERYLPADGGMAERSARGPRRRESVPPAR